MANLKTPLLQLFDKFKFSDIQDDFIALNEEVEQITNPNNFIANGITNGRAKLPGGLIIQWGYWEHIAEVDSDGYNHTIQFIGNFPNACLNVSLTPSQISKGANYPVSPVGYGVTEMDTGNFKMKLNQQNGLTYQLYWLAIGY